MVDINVLKKSYRSRPRTSVVVLGVFGILIGLLCLFLTLCFDYFPSFFFDFEKGTIHGVVERCEFAERKCAVFYVLNRIFTWSSETI